MKACTQCRVKKAGRHFALDATGKTRDVCKKCAVIEPLATRAKAGNVAGFVQHADTPPPPAVTLSYGLEVLPGYGFRATLEDDRLSIEQDAQDDGGGTRTDNVTLSRTEAKVLFAQFSEWAADLQPGLVVSVLLKDLHPDPDQPRKSFDEKSLQKLAENIRERGVQQPILVRYDSKGRITIVDGERRWRAAKVVKLSNVPVLLAATSSGSDQLRLDQVSVNQLREQLKPMDLARVLRSMRDGGGTTNDMAATLTKQGHPSTPAQIDALTALTDLPEWGQAMIDAEEIEPGPARKILEVMDIKGIEKPLRKRLEQAVGYTGQLHAKNVGHEIGRVLEELFVSLNRVESWERNPVHFAWKTRCKLQDGKSHCPHLKPFDGRGYCMNAKLFKEHNQEAIAAGLLPGGKRPEKPKPVTGKAAEKEIEQKTEQRERSLGEKARDYLHSYLALRLQGAVPSMPSAATWLVTWAAMKKPGSRSTHGPIGVFYGGEAGSSSAASQGVKGFEDVLDPNADVAALIAAAAQEILCDLPWRETQLLARQFWGSDLQNAWKLDAAFLDLFRKAELLHLVDVHHVPLIAKARSWESMKHGDLKVALFDQADKLTRPAILVDLYEGEIQAPYNPRGWQDGEDEEETVCIGCGCTHTDPCEQGCGWATETDVDDQDRLVAVCDSPGCAPHLERFENADLTLSPEAEARVAKRTSMRADDVGEDDLEEVDAA